MNAHGKITNRGYSNVPISLQSKVDRAEKYALQHYEEHRKKRSNLYKEAEFKILHNLFDDTTITKEQCKEMIKLEFIHLYTERMIWKDIHKERKQHTLNNLNYILSLIEKNKTE